MYIKDMRVIVRYKCKPAKRYTKLNLFLHYKSIILEIISCELFRALPTTKNVTINL